MIPAALEGFLTQVAMIVGEQQARMPLEMSVITPIQAAMIAKEQQAVTLQAAQAAPVHVHTANHNRTVAVALEPLPAGAKVDIVLYFPQDHPKMFF